MMNTLVLTFSFPQAYKDHEKSHGLSHQVESLELTRRPSGLPYIESFQKQVVLPLLGEPTQLIQN